jgi:hypothetical protein
MCPQSLGCSNYSASSIDALSVGGLSVKDNMQFAKLKWSLQNNRVAAAATGFLLLAGQYRS